MRYDRNENLCFLQFVPRYKVLKLYLMDTRRSRRRRAVTLCQQFHTVYCKSPRQILRIGAAAPNSLYRQFYHLWFSKKVGVVLLKVRLEVRADSSNTSSCAQSLLFCLSRQTFLLPTQYFHECGLCALFLMIFHYFVLLIKIRSGIWSAKVNSLFYGNLFVVKQLMLE